MFIPNQYKESSNFQAFIEALNSEAITISNEIADVIDLRWLEKAEGINLDILGALVGISREVVDFVDTIYFGFDPDPTALSFGDLDDPTVGGRYRSALENPVQTRLLSDNEYRILISAKVLKNQTTITPNDVLLITREIMKLMYPNDGELIAINIDELGNASFKIMIYRLLSGSEQAFISELDLIPRPVGVKIEYEYLAP